MRALILRPEERYTPKQIVDLLTKAEAQGHPLGPGSYLLKMTLPQIQALVDGKTDA